MAEGVRIEVEADPAVPISDTDQLRETCSGMYGGSEAFIEGMSTLEW